MNEHDDLIARLRAMGEHPVEPATASRHLTAMAGVTRTPRVPRFGRAKVVAAFAAGIVLGGTSLASAGVMGQTVQNKVADAAAHVNLDLPGGTHDNHRTARSQSNCAIQGVSPTPTYRNHGAYVSAGGDAKSDCGKPQKAVDNKANGNDGQQNGQSDACKPPWAGKGNHSKKTPDAVAAHNAQCPDNASEAPSTESDSTEAPKTTPTASAQQGQDTADENKATTATPSLTTDHGDTTESSGTVKSNEGDKTTPSSTTPGQGNDRQGSDRQGS